MTGARHSGLPHVVVLTTGGTIAMSDAANGTVAPALDAGDLLQWLAGYRLPCSVEARNLLNRPGASLTTADMLAVLDAAADAVRAGAAGVVVTQGTDTLEETAFFCDLLWGSEAPLVLTGAMRNPTMAGADGPANLLAALTVAASADGRGLGCLVVLNDEIHAARFVRKEHSGSPAAFRSPAAGPVGAVREGSAVVHTTVSRRRPLAWPGPMPARVALVESTFDDHGGLLASGACESFDGVVVAGFGAGHLSEAAAAAAVELAARKPVVLASRCGAGGSLRSTYGFVGSESYLLERGLISAGDLDARKARLLLLVLLSQGRSRQEVRSAFEESQA